MPPPTNPGACVIKLAQVGQRLGIARIQPDRLFKLRPHPLGQRIRAQERGPVCLLAQGAAQPQVIVGVLPVQLHRLLALACGGIPVLQGVYARGT